MTIIKDEMNWVTKEKAMSAIRNNKELSPLQKVIIDAFVRCDPKKYKPTISTLASQFGVKRRCMLYQLKTLKKFGYIEIVRISPTNNNNTILYVHPKPCKSGAF